MECSDALAGPRCHIVHYPLSDWKAFNLVVTYHNNAPEPVAGKPVSHDEVRKGLNMSIQLHARSSNEARTGNCGCCATENRRVHGLMGASRCSEMPLTRCSNISRKVPVWH